MAGISDNKKCCVKFLAKNDCFLTYFLLLFFSCATSLANAEWHRAQENIMGTRIAVEFWLEDKLAAEQITEKVFADFRSVEALLSPYIETSELYRVNREASEKSIEISAEFFQLLQKSLYFSKVSHGAFDVSFASVGYHYDYRQGKAPTEQQISQGLNAVDYKKNSLG